MYRLEWSKAISGWVWDDGNLCIKAPLLRAPLCSADKSRPSVKVFNLKTINEDDNIQHSCLLLSFLSLLLYIWLTDHSQIVSNPLLLVQEIAFVLWYLWMIRVMSGVREDLCVLAWVTGDGGYIPHICHFLYTRTFFSRKFYTQECVNLRQKGPRNKIA